jgi:hypothetical protein
MYNIEPRLQESKIDNVYLAYTKSNIEFFQYI